MTIITEIGLPRSQASPVFCSSVCVEYNTRKQKSAKNGEGLVSFITCVTSGGCEVDVGGMGTTANMLNQGQTSAKSQAVVSTQRSKQQISQWVERSVLVSPRGREHLEYLLNRTCWRIQLAGFSSTCPDVEAGFSLESGSSVPSGFTSICHISWFHHETSSFKATDQVRTCSTSVLQVPSSLVQRLKTWKYGTM